MAFKKKRKKVVRARVLKAPKKKRAPARAKGLKRAKKKVVRTKGEGLKLEKVGEVTHYFPHVKAAAILVVKDGLKVGENIYIKGHTTDFKEKIKSMQLDRVPIQEAKKAQEIGLLVKSRVRIGDTVYRV